MFRGRHSIERSERTIQPKRQNTMSVRISAVDDMTRNQNKEENLLMYEIPDDVLETVACTGNGKANNFTQWVCTALYFCPGP
jgi:hypothetical protein